MRHLIAIFALVAAPLPAAAQMMLPGAVAPTGEGAAVTPAGGGPRPPAKARARSKDTRASGGAPAAGAPAKVPAPATLAGQTLYLNGGKSQIVFELRDKAVAVSRLVLAGEHMSNGREACEVDVPGAPLGTTDLGRPNGVSRFQLSVPACPIAFDVLDGAVLAVGDPAACEFKEANCRVAPDGLWGPQPSVLLAPDKAKGIERSRAQAEGSARANFKRLLGATKDKATIMAYAREQAGFSSTREETCRDYAGEDKHGFCAAKLTEAHAAALRAKGDVEAEARQERKLARQRKHAG